MIVFGSNHPMIPMINGHVLASGSTPTSFCRIAFSPWPSSGFPSQTKRASPDEPFIGWRKVLYNRFGRQKRHKAYYTLLYYINIYIYTYYIIICIHTCINCWVCPNMAYPIFRSCVSFPIPRKKTAPWILHVPSLSGVGSDTHGATVGFDRV